MNPYKHHTLDELLLMPLNENVFDRILEILDEISNLTSVAATFKRRITATYHLAEIT